MSIITQDTCMQLKSLPSQAAAEQDSYSTLDPGGGFPQKLSCKELLGRTDTEYECISRYTECALCIQSTSHLLYSLRVFVVRLFSPRRCTCPLDAWICCSRGPCETRSLWDKPLARIQKHWPHRRSRTSPSGPLRTVTRRYHI